MPKKITSNERARRAALRESRKHGYEYRPTTSEQSDLARRLNEGLEILNQDGNGIEADED
jgi:hypothetical protein